MIDNLDFFTIVLGAGIATATIAAFFYMLLLQDRYYDKMRDRFDNGDGSLRV